MNLLWFDKWGRSLISVGMNLVVGRETRGVDVAKLLTAGGCQSTVQTLDPMGRNWRWSGWHAVDGVRRVGLQGGSSGSVTDVEKGKSRWWNRRKCWRWWRVGTFNTIGFLVYPRHKKYVVLSRLIGCSHGEIGRFTVHPLHTVQVKWGRVEIRSSEMRRVMWRQCFLPDSFWEQIHGSECRWQQPTSSQHRPGEDKEAAQLNPQNSDVENCCQTNHKVQWLQMAMTTGTLLC